MNYWIDTPEYRKNIEFLDRKTKNLRKGMFWQVFGLGIDVDNERGSYKTYRGIFNSGKYQFAVNFTAYSNGTSEARLLGVDHIDDPSLPIPYINNPVVLDTNIENVYNTILDSIRNITGLKVRIAYKQISYEAIPGQIKRYVIRKPVKNDNKPFKGKIPAIIRLHHKPHHKN